MDFFVSRRAFTDVFLFHAAHLYELIHVSESSTLFDKMMMHKMDPYGCISYKVYCKDKQRFEGKHLNRSLEKVVVVCTKDDEYHKDFSQNVLKLNKWSGEPEMGLFGLLNFLHSLYFSGINDFRPTLMSYTGKDFHEAFEKVQKAVFVSRNMFSWNTGRKYEGRVEEINRCRINDYESARKVMDKDVNNVNSDEGLLSVFGSIMNLVVRVFL
ncbi:mitochondrial inner membrane protein required for protein import [Ordospora colligata]